MSTLLRDCRIWRWTNENSGSQIEGSFHAGWILFDASGTIRQVGLDVDAAPEPALEGTRVISAHGNLVLPGLIDSHIHIAGLGESLSFLQLACSDTIGKLQDVLRTAPDESLAKCVQGTHWDQEKLGRYPTRFDIDAVIADRPVILWRACWHIVVCNTLALTMAGVLTKDGLPNADVKLPVGGVIDVDEMGSPTGILRESAVELVTAVVPSKTLEQKRMCIKAALRQCCAFGLTSVQTNDERCVRAYRTLVAEDALDLRVFLTPTWAELGQEAEQRESAGGDKVGGSGSGCGDASEGSEGRGACAVADVDSDLEAGEKLTPFRPVALTNHSPSSTVLPHGGGPGGLGDASSKLIIERLKIFSDGSLGAETAAIRTHAVVTTDVMEKRDATYSGVFIHTSDSLKKQVAAARARGFRVEIHAIGDAAAERVLDCLEACSVSPSERPIITHCQVLGADLLPRMAALGCVADVQPSFVPTDMRWVSKRLSADHIQFAYAWKTLLYTRGLTVAGGSDAPIESSSPLLGIYDAMHRSDRESGEIFRPEECLTFAEALWIYTVGGAKACGSEHVLGRIETGFAADLTLVSPRILDDPEELKRPSAVKQVFVGGRVVYTSEADLAPPGELTSSALGGPYFPGKNGARRTSNPWAANCLCCVVRGR